MSALTPTRLRVVLVSLSKILASPKSATLTWPPESNKTVLRAHGSKWQTGQPDWRTAK
jgi:hypothetical protein